MFGWPGWTLDVSLFHPYGTPLTVGIYWVGLGIMLGIVGIGFGGAALAMRRRDVGR